MFIKLTNANPAHKGKKVAIRKDLIATVHRSTILREDGTSEEVTFVFAPPHGTWEVEETFEKVMVLMK
jgi:transposase